MLRERLLQQTTNEVLLMGLEAAMRQMLEIADKGRIELDLAYNSAQYWRFLKDNADRFGGIQERCPGIISAIAERVANWWAVLIYSKLMFIVIKSPPNDQRVHLESICTLLKAASKLTDSELRCNLSQCIPAIFVRLSSLEAFRTPEEAKSLEEWFFCLREMSDSVWIVQLFLQHGLRARLADPR